MKPYIYLFLIMIFISGQARAQETRDLGSVDLSKNKDYYLSAFEKGGKFIYKIYNQNDPATEVTSFSLINNNFDNFKEMMNSATQEHDSLENIDLEELEKYYFYFTTQNVFLIENEPGKKAMEMVFKEAIPVYAYHHSNFAAIKSQDIYYMMVELFPDAEVDKSFLDNLFNYEFYEAWEKESPIKIFDNSFKAILEKTSRIKNRNEKLEMLYKEINKKYYDAIHRDIKNKLDKYENDERNLIDRLTEEISEHTQNNKSLIADTLSEWSQIEKLQQDIQDAEKTIASNKKKLLAPITRFSFDENENPVSSNEENTNLGNDNQTEQRRELAILIRDVTSLYESLSSSNLVQIREVSELLFTEGENLLDVKIKKIDSLKLALEGIENNLNEIENLQSNIVLKQEVIRNLKSSIRTNKVELITESWHLDSLNDEMKAINIEKAKKISSQLEQLYKTNKFEFRPSSVQLEINRGYLENIIVNGSASIFDYKKIEEKDTSKIIPEFHLKFINDFPFGISSKKDIEQLGNFKLYARFKNGTHYELKLEDFIDVIIEKLELDRKDFSPKDDSYELSLPSENKKIFYKADSKEILQVKIFSDFVGIQDNNPNGLIQLEIDKEIPLITKRFQKPYVVFFLRPFVLNQANIGVLNYFKPQFIYSKIENNNKYLEVTSIPNGDTGGSVGYGVSTLDLKQFEVFSVGADFNIFLYDIPNTKSTILFNTGFRFGRTELALDQDEPEVHDFPRGFTNTLQPSLEGLLRINGDERFGFEFSYGINWLLSDELFFTQKANVNGFTDFETFSKSNENNTLQKATILAYLNINKENQGRLFFRYRYNAELGNFKNNFAQLQIGYTTYLTRQNK